MTYVKTKVKADYKGLYNLHTRLKTLDQWSSKVGFWEEVNHPNGKIDSASLANKLQNGSPEENIPARPFMTDGTIDSEIELRSMFLSRFHNFLGLAGRKTSPRDTLHPLGLAVSRWISQRILFNNYVENAKLTERLKGFNRPLYETGWLSENVQVKTRRKER